MINFLQTSYGCAAPKESFGATRVTVYWYAQRTLRLVNEYKLIQIQRIQTKILQ